MIRLTRINRVPLVLNSDLIEHVEITPDTVIAMTTGQKFMVLESADEVIQRVIDFRRTIGSRPDKISACEEPMAAGNEER
jgi:flagellar protein FlbD